MTSTTERYRAAASQSASTVEKIADFWTQGSQRLNDYMLPRLPQVDLIPVVERYFEFVQRTVDISRDLTLKWAEAAGTLSGAVREQAESVGGLAREQAESTRDFVHEQASKAEQAARRSKVSWVISSPGQPEERPDPKKPTAQRGAVGVWNCESSDFSCSRPPGTRGSGKTHRRTSGKPDPM